MPRGNKREQLQWSENGPLLYKTKELTCRATWWLLKLFFSQSLLTKSWMGGGGGALLSLVRGNGGQCELTPGLMQKMSQG